MLTRLFSMACVIFLMHGCAAPSESSGTYSRRDAMKVQSVQHGNVIMVDDVIIDGEYTRVGSWGGAGIGYTVGRSIGDGHGSKIMGAVGAVGGAVAGQAIEKSLTTEDGYQITVALDSGKVIAIVQATDVSFSEGERVRVLVSRRSGTARVMKM